MKKFINGKYLLPAVVILWGVICFELYYFWPKSEEEALPEPFKVAKIKPLNKKKKESFKLEALTKDPFLGEIKREKRVVNSSNNNSSSKFVSKNDNDPIIYYKGKLENKDSKSKIFVLNINNSQHLFKVNQTIKGVKLLKGTADFIVVKQNNKRLKIDRI